MTEVRSRSASARWGFPLLITVACLLVYGQVGGFDFLNWDDDKNVTQNPYLYPAGFGSLAAFWSAPFAGLYVPVSYTFWTAEAWLSRSLSGGGVVAPLDPAVFHTGNLVLHVLCALAVLRLLRQLVASSAAAGLGALLFALHPLQVETVAWVTETRGLLSAGLSFVAISLYLQAVRGAGAAPDDATPDDAAPHDATPGRKPYALGTLAFAAALLAKPSAVAVPLLCAVLDRWHGQRPWRAVARTVAPWILLAAGVAVLSKLLQPSSRLSEVAPLWQRPWVAADALGFYLSKLFWPVGLAADYARPPQKLEASSLYWLLAVGTYALVAFVPALRRARDGALLWLAALLPVLGLVPFAYQQHSTVADRYAYVALFGAALALASALSRTNRAAVLAAAGVALAVLGWRAHEQTGVWADSKTLFRHTLEVSPQSAVSNHNLAQVFHLEGDGVVAENYYREAIRIRPDFAQAHNNLGLLLESRGELEAARRQFERAAELDPLYDRAHYCLGLNAQKRGDLAAARKHLRDTLALAPEHSEAHNALAWILWQAGELADAEHHYREAVAVDPRHARAFQGLGNVLALGGRFDEATAAFESAVEVDPNYARAWNGLGRSLAARGQLTRARECIQRALELDPELADAHVNLALFALQSKDATAARRHLEEALRLQPEHPEAAQLLQGLGAD